MSKLKYRHDLRFDQITGCKVCRRCCLVAFNKEQENTACSPANPQPNQPTCKTCLGSGVICGGQPGDHSKGEYSINCPTCHGTGKQPKSCEI